MRRVGSTIRIDAEPKGDRGRCPGCDGESARVHSRYRRQLADTAIGGHPVMIDLRVRRFFCDTIDCTAKTFAEQVPGLTKSRSRRTPGLGAMVTAIGLAVAGRAGFLRRASNAGVGQVHQGDEGLRLVRLEGFAVGQPSLHRTQFGVTTGSARLIRHFLDRPSLTTARSTAPPSVMRV
ncbi:transposase family protein [Rhodococcus sp. LB1]|uniref:transposase family protein n=1 Tax=Rhodococcus sp. LB1 TaxID=1807499 RepID=UPI0022B24F29|nr:transposase family protein [Rhodococcus sp. LB1]